MNTKYIIYVVTAYEVQIIHNIKYTSKEITSKIGKNMIELILVLINRLKLDFKKNTGKINMLNFLSNTVFKPFFKTCTLTTFFTLSFLKQQ